MNHSEGQQERILRTFTLLYSLRQDWGGALIIACGLNSRGTALALASNIAGAVCLSIEDDPAHIKDSIRSGACDFVVNTLDEALRAMKNELRKHLPLSVGLQGNPVAILDELLERGVVPEIFTDLSSNSVYKEAASHLQTQGARILSFNTRALDNDSLNAESQLNTFLHQQHWKLHTFTFETSAAQRTFDTQALSLLPQDDHLRRRWLQAAPRILQRERPLRRILWLTEDESQQLDSSAER